WNIFQRESLEKQELNKAQYKTFLKQLSHDWKAMSQDDREAYQVQAEHEDLNKRSLLEQALPAGSKPLMEAKEDGVRHHTRQKISHKRLLKNFDAARN
ncbi:unnamed protein product, partial [Durusdinium trenchii]